VAVAAGALQAAGVRPEERVVVAVSGGVDSMVLLHALVRLVPRLDLRLHVAHIHHGLRGRSADRDAAFVSAEAVRYGLPISVERLAAETRPAGTSVQVWAREVRYARLEAIRKKTGAAWILTAHTQNDQAETVLLNLLRGTGPRGLAGIPGRRDRILRPLLAVSRREIVTYAAKQRVAFREDPSNRSVAYRRNRIRRELLPLLAREYNPRIVETLTGLAAQAREDEDALALQAAALAAGAIRERGPSVGVNVALLRAASPSIARRLLQEGFRRATDRRHGLTRRHVSALMRAAARGGSVPLPGGLRALASAEYLWLGPRAPSERDRGSGARSPVSELPPDVPLRPGRWVRWDPGQCFVRVRRVEGDRIRLTRRDSRREVLSPALLREPLRLRAWRPGDRFQPLGLPGGKKLQDFFVDAKVPREERCMVPLLVAGERVAWVVGHRIAETFRWTGERVACLAEVRFSEERHGVPAGPDPAVGR
jgi:tRNA(Ile)-lysidine synthase